MTKLKFFKLLLAALLWGSLCASSGKAQTPTKPDPTPPFYKVTPTGTWLKVDTSLPADRGGPDIATPPTTVLLTKLKLKAGDFVALRETGAFDANSGAGDTINDIIGVFMNVDKLVAPGPTNPPPEHVTLRTCPRGIPTDVKGDFGIPNKSWIIVQVPKGADRIAFGPDDCFWKDNTDPNGDYGVQIVTLRDAVKNAVSWIGGGNGITGTFTPPWNLTTQQVAALGGYDSLNWVQVITYLGVNGIRLRGYYCKQHPDLDCDAFADRNGHLPITLGKTYYIIDPIFGGYKYQTTDFGRPFPVRDDQPWYLDNIYGPRGEIGGKSQRLIATTDSQLMFEDSPFMPLGFDMEFLVGLAGTNKGGKTGDLLLASGAVVSWKALPPLGQDIVTTPETSIDPRVQNFLSRLGVGIRNLQ